MYKSKFNKLFKLVMEDAYSYNTPNGNPNITINADSNNIKFKATAWILNGNNVENEIHVSGTTVDACMKQICKKLNILEDWHKAADFYDIPVQCNTPYSDDVICSLPDPNSQNVYDVMIEKYVTDPKTNETKIYNICQEDLYNKNLQNNSEKNYTLLELKQLPAMTRVLGKLIIAGSHDIEEECSEVSTVRQWIMAFKALQQAEKEEGNEIQLSFGHGSNTESFSLKELQHAISFQLITPQEEKAYNKYTNLNAGLQAIFNCEYF